MIGRLLNLETSQPSTGKILCQTLPNIVAKKKHIISILCMDINLVLCKMKLHNQPVTFSSGTCKAKDIFLHEVQ